MIRVGNISCIKLLLNAIPQNPTPKIKRETAAILFSVMYSRMADNVNASNPGISLIEFKTPNSVAEIFSSSPTKLLKVAWYKDQDKAIQKAAIIMMRNLFIERVH